VKDIHGTSSWRFVLPAKTAGFLRWTVLWSLESASYNWRGNHNGSRLRAVSRSSRENGNVTEDSDDYMTYRPLCQSALVFARNDGPPSTYFFIALTQKSNLTAENLR
jgi:hypothetical protein